MDTDFNFLGELPADDSVYEASNTNLPLTTERPGTGQELGEYGLGGFDDSSSVTVDTAFKPLTPIEASFDPRLAFEIALGNEEPEDIYPRYGLTYNNWMSLIMQPTFKQAVVQHQNEIIENGISYRLKAKVQSEAYLKDAHLLIKHPMTPPNTKLAAIQWVAKMADLEPRKEAAEQGTTFNLQINM